MPASLFASFLAITASCKTFNNQLEAKAVETEGASFADNTTGIVDIIYW